MGAITDADGHVAQVTSLGELLVTGSISTSPPVGASSEATLIQVRDYLDTVETKLQSIITNTATEVSIAALLAEFRNRYDVVNTAKATYTTSGNHTLITPPSGQSIRLVWTYLQAKSVLDTGNVAVTVTLGANSYEIELTGSQAFAHGAVWEGAVDQTLVINTSSTAAVLVNVDYRIF